MALRTRNGGSQTPDYWLKLARNTHFQFGPLLWVLNLIGNNAFRRGVHLNPLLNTPNGTIVKIVSFLLSQRNDMDIQQKKS